MATRHDKRLYVSRQGRIYHDKKRNAYRVVFGRQIRKRFVSEDDAIVFLTALRFQQDTNTLDPRDHIAAKPLAFKNIYPQWLETKKGKSRNYYRNMERWMFQAEEMWKSRNVKTITYGDIDDLISRQPLSNKTKADMANVFSQFFTWLSKREKIPMPDIPRYEYTLGWREIIDLETQAAIVAEVKRIAPYRVWLGVKWLATYISIRPGEMRKLRERDVNVGGMLVVRPQTAKERKPKLVPMVEEDIALVKALPKGLPDLPFFRWSYGRQFGEHIFYSWWKKACKNLSITGVDLYGGTRHSSTSAMAAIFGKEELRESGTMHGTNKAFERYCQREAEPSRRIYEELVARRLPKEDQKARHD